MEHGGPGGEVPIERWRSFWRRDGVRELQEVLLVWWDPIGVYGEPEARDEYAAYVPRLAGLLRAGAREAEITAHLRALEAEEIGATGQAELAGDRIVRWHDHAMAALSAAEPSAPD